MNKEITTDDYGNISYFRSVPMLLARLCHLMDKVSYMTVEGLTTSNLRHEFDKRLSALMLQMKTWEPFIKSPLSGAAHYDVVLDAVKGTFDVAEFTVENDLDNSQDPHDVIDVDKFEIEYRQLIALEVLFSLSSDTYPFNVFKKVYYHLLSKYFETLNAVIDIFNLNQEKLFFTGLEIPSKLMFVMHEKQMFMTAEERTAKIKAEEEKAREEAKAAALKKAQEAVAAHAKVVLDSYNQQKKLGNLQKFTFTADAVRLLESPANTDDCETVEAIYSFLMAMSCSQRYMPGEQGEDFDRIMGSFMELENDVLSYNGTFQMYLGEFMLTHSKTARALELFDQTNGKIVAQYVDTKEWIDGPDPEKDHSHASFQIFKM